MRPEDNPFTPSPGFRPPELAGRADALALGDAAVAALKRGRAATPTIIYGLRGVGKTVLLNLVEEKARAADCQVIYLEATDRAGLGEVLVPELTRVLSRLSGVAKAKQLAGRALAAVQDVLAQVEFSYGDAKVAVKRREGAAAHGVSLELSLRDALVAVGEAAQAAQIPVLLCVDELQSLQLRDEGRDLGALVAAIHRVGQRGLPVGLVAVGLPQIHSILSRQRSYTERFAYERVGALAPPDAARAIHQPIVEQGAAITDDALGAIVERTRGYPAFLQEYGYHTWNAAEGPTITVEDVGRADEAVTAALDRGFFESRMQRVTEREKEYLYAMASLGAGPYDTAAVTRQLGETPQATSPYRDALIKKGIVWAPKRAVIEFTVPMFDAYLRRREPDLIKPAVPPQSPDRQGGGRGTARRRR